MLIARSLSRKIIVTAVAAGAFVLAYEVKILDSKYGTLQSTFGGVDRDPAPGARLAYSATAYCKGLATTSGVAVQNGIAAADPTVLPVGSVVQTESSDGEYDGIYTVLDTGPAVQGRLLDIYIWNCNEALRFGRKSIMLTVLRFGWNPRATTPSFMQRLFRRTPPPTTPPPLPSRPLPIIQPVDQPVEQS